MKTSVIGYPRIGDLRELKFATEKYFRGEITANELENTAKQIRLKNFELQKANGIDFIPSNDFSYYDNVLDTAFLLGAVPARYTQLGLNVLDTYFAAARGYQGEKGDVKALAMKKWYNTNYHYIVAELDDSTQIKLTGTKPLDLYKEAADAGVQTKPTLIGPYTFLKLATYKGKKQAADFADDTAAAYSELVQKLSALGAQWVQFEEPSLVKDMSEEDIGLFVSLYQKILCSKGTVKLLLQTYFGDVRDCCEQLFSLDFDGIGLDFTEGKKSLELVMKNGFPKGKVLFAGVVCEKNIWRNDYQKTAGIIRELKKFADDIVITTSCSLLHVPCTLDNETRLREEYKKHFAFAKEKLTELSQLGQILDSDNIEQSPFYIHNKALHSEKRAGTNDAVRNKIAALTDKDFVRLPEFSEREKIQK
jgi:5-methyltetrahydropteroyltriglutamate--homocysteine methyltransferase